MTSRAHTITKFTLKIENQFAKESCSNYSKPKKTGNDSTTCNDRPNKFYLNARKGNILEFCFESASHAHEQRESAFKSVFV